MADDLNQPYIGYRSAGRRPESQQDRAGAREAPLAALRGALSGVLGAPGDIEALVRMLPGLNEQTVLPTSEDVERWLPGRAVSQSSPTGRAFTGAGQLAGGFYAGPGSPLRAIAALPGAVRKAGRDFVMAAGQPAVNVVKPRGGNWLAGSVERTLEPLKVKEPTQESWRQMLRRLNVSEEDMPARIAEARSKSPASALNDWIEQKLGNYVRNELATPADPLRTLAERGVHPLPAEELMMSEGWVPDEVIRRRKAAGFPEEGVALEPLQRGGLTEEQLDAMRRAAGWENIADAMVDNPTVEQLMRKYGGVPELMRQNPWLKDLPPGTRVHEVTGSAGDFGLDVVTQGLRDMLAAGDKLPRKMRLKPEDLKKTSLPQAVEKLDSYKAWLDEQAELANPAIQTFKEYPEAGMRWVEIKLPEGIKADDLPSRSDPEFVRWMGQEGYDLEVPGALDEARATYALRQRGATPEEPGTISALERALVREGEAMGNCVGDYCEDVALGSTRIFSLRDKKGQPHVTIEVRPGAEPRNWDDVKEAVGPEETARLQKEFEAIGGNNMDDTDAGLRMFIRQKGIVPPESIFQIKGSGKKDTRQRLRHSGTGYIDNPDAALMPLVQDFVRSGRWGRVMDLDNAGLTGIDLNSDVARRAREAGVEVPRYVTQEELTRLLDQYGRTELPSVPAAPRRPGEMPDLFPDWEPPRPQGRADEGPDFIPFAHGGAVMRTEHTGYDAATIDALAAQLSEELNA